MAAMVPLDPYKEVPTAPLVAEVLPFPATSAVALKVFHSLAERQITPLQAWPQLINCNPHDASKLAKSKVPLFCTRSFTFTAFYSVWAYLF